MTAAPEIHPPQGRLVLGGAIFLIGQLTPLLVPVVARLELTGVLKTILMVVVLIAPELFVLIAAAMLGKAGFDFLMGRIKQILGRFFKKHGPPDTVGRTRYRIGLVMFMVPLLLGWAAPYAAHHLPGYEAHPIWYSVPGDLLLVASLFVLGGDFWDKLRALFIHGAKAQMPGAGESE